MKRFVGITLVTTGIFYVATCLGLFLFQRSLIYHPRSFQRDDPAEIISFNNEGATIKVSVRETKNKNALIYFPGNAEDVSLVMPHYKNAFPDHAIYIPHYRGYGGSAGDPTEMALNSDAQKLYELVRPKHSHILVIGRSLGSGIAIRLAATHPTQRLVLITPYDSILNVAKQRFPIFPVESILLDRFESWKYAPAITAPTTIIAIEKDDIIPFNSTKALLATFKPGIATLKIINDTDHVTINDHPDYFPLIQQN